MLYYDSLAGYSEFLMKNFQCPLRFIILRFHCMYVRMYVLEHLRRAEHCVICVCRSMCPVSMCLYNMYCGASGEVWHMSCLVYNNALYSLYIRTYVCIYIRMYVCIVCGSLCAPCIVLMLYQLVPSWTCVAGTELELSQ